MTPINRHTQWPLLDTVVGWRSGARRLARPSAEPASVARQAQTTVSAIGGLRLAAPCSVAAASARGCGRTGVRDHFFGNANEPTIHTTSRC